MAGQAGQDMRKGQLGTALGLLPPTLRLRLCMTSLALVQVRCTNYTAHLGRWSVPVTREEGEMEGVCGIDGCF